MSVHKTGGSPNLSQPASTKPGAIHTDIYDELRNRLHAIAKTMQVGSGDQDGVTFGPIQNEPQFRRLQSLIASARSEGLNLLEGCPVSSEGYFIPITLVDNPPEDSRVVQEEAFGPVLPLLRFSDVGDAIERINSSNYGLGGAVWSGDIDAAVAVAKKIETGTVWINQYLQTGAHIPLSGAKQSGLGVENGQSGLLEYTQMKTIFIPKKV